MNFLWLSLAALAPLQDEVVNAPITPDTIYVGRGGSISVIDLNGFGQGTGNPTFDPDCPIQEGNTNFPNNPNVALQGLAMTPPLVPGTTTLDGGSEGVFTLTKSSELSDRLAKSPMLSSVSDIMIGRSLDGAFNNGPPPFGCQAGGGNLCATTGNKLINVVVNDDGTAEPGFGTGLPVLVGANNPVSWAPHPNPPPLLETALCQSPALDGQEPTSVDTDSFNLLGPSSNSMGVPQLCIPPTGLLSSSQNAFFGGPSIPSAQISSCTPFSFRQQIGHFLYVADRAADEVVILNSNRFTVIDRISVADPVDLAMSPNVDFLAVTSFSEDEVSFIDIDPDSSTFHQVVKVTSVGDGPTEIAWDPGNEVIAVCNSLDDSVDLIQAFSFEVGKTVSNGVEAPVGVVISQRQLGFGYERNVFFAWILNGDGTVAVYESGPDGVNGFGLNDIVAVPRVRFPKAKAIALDPVTLRGAVWVAHEDAQGNGVVSRLAITSANPGVQPLLSNPTHDDLRFGVTQRITSDVLTGVPVDLAFDDLKNLGILPNVFNPFSAGVPTQINGKGQVRLVGNEYVPTNNPQFLFVSVETPAGDRVIDVIDRRTGTRVDTNPFHVDVQSIPISGAGVVATYFRQ